MSSVLLQEISPITVSEIQELEFSELSFHEKVIIKIRGRPTPDLKISQPGYSNNKVYVRSFNSEWYQRKSWLCGCEVKNALFCFPCLLLGGNEAWSKDGVKNINKLKEKAVKHDICQKHINNVITLSLLGSVDIKERFSEAYQLPIDEHNRKVTKNREILSKIIDCITFCGNFEIPLHGHDERDDSVIPGIFRGLIDFASKLDSDLKNHLETNTVFKGVSDTIQNEILDCLLQIYKDEIKKEIKEASFLAVMADDTTDVSEHTQMVIVLRYVLKGEIFERFWGFFNPENLTTDGLSKCILEQLDTVLQGDKQKLVSQTFDGANFMKGKKGDVQTKIKAIHENAHFIHCNAHQPNSIMKNAASVTLDSRIFFSNILAVPAFFARSPQRVSILTKHMSTTIQNPNGASWDFNIQTVNKVYESLQPLKHCLAEIQSTSNTDQTISEAAGILRSLNDTKFMFWLKLFHQITPHVEIIYNQMQSPEIDAFKVHEYISNFKSSILEIRKSKYCENPSKLLTDGAKEVCDSVCVDIEERYYFAKQLIASKLFNKNNLRNFKKNQPAQEVRLTTEAYPMVDKEKLSCELSVFYSRSDMHGYCKLIDLLKFILENKLDSVLCEITKLLLILLTIPRCFSMLKRIKTFLRSTINPERLDALAVISLERKFFCSHPNIKEKVIDLFAQNKLRKTDFVFK